MRNKIPWIITGILLVALSIMQFNLQSKYQLIEQNGFTFYLIDFASNIMLVSIFGAIIGSLIALIPYKNLNFKQKFKVTFLSTTSLGLLLLLFSPQFQVPAVKYDDINVPSTLDCSDIRNGEFETDDIIIKRQDNIQIEIDKETKKEERFNVEWLSDCEYALSSTDNPTSVLKVKITNIQPDEYECFATIDKYVKHFKIRR
jgi:hypothetical protein